MIFMNIARGLIPHFSMKKPLGYNSGFFPTTVAHEGQEIYKKGSSFTQLDFHEV